MKKKNTVIITQQFFSVDTGDGSKKYLLLVETEGNKIIQVIKLFRLAMFSCQNGIVKGIKNGTTTKSFGIRVILTGYGKTIEISTVKFLYG